MVILNWSLWFINYNKIDTYKIDQFTNINIYLCIWYEHMSACVLKQIWPHSEVGTLSAGWPGHIPGNAKVAFHERTGTDC